MQWFGIDTSRYQGDFNFKQAVAEGVQFVILKAGGGDDGLYKDSQFENSYKKCKELNLPVGAYFFGDARTKERAVEEADYFLSLLKGKLFDMPVYYDVEANMLKLEKHILTDICLAFLDRVEAAGYYTGIYGNLYSFNTKIDDNLLTHYCHWTAYWDKTKPNLKSGADTGLWQFGGEVNLIRDNKVAGVVCDQDYCFVDYPSAIKELGLNGYSKPQPKPEYEIAKPALCFGTYNKYVIVLQENLRALGYDVTADGLFDGRTEAALRDWQASVSLPVTGIYSTEDYEKMVVSL